MIKIVNLGINGYLYSHDFKIISANLDVSSFYKNRIENNDKGILVLIIEQETRKQRKKQTKQTKEKKKRNKETRGRKIY